MFRTSTVVMFRPARSLRRARRQLPRGWWVIPGALAGAAIWGAVLFGLFRLLG